MDSNRMFCLPAVRAQGVLKLLRSLLERFPSSNTVRAAITALTHIAADTVVHVPDQVSQGGFSEQGSKGRYFNNFTHT